MFRAQWHMFHWGHIPFFLVVAVFFGGCLFFAATEFFLVLISGSVVAIV